MLIVIQLILAFILTLIKTSNIGITLNFLGIVSIILIFIAINIIITIVYLLIFVIIIYSIEKIDYKKIWKHRLIHIFSMYLYRHLSRVKLIVTGKENLPKNRNFVIYANHIEYTDPIYIMQAFQGFPLAFIAKEPLFKIPILKNLMLGLGNLPLSRFANRDALKTILKAIEQVKNGMPMGIFPESKRTYSNNLIEFKVGSFKLAQKAKADICPVTLYNMHKLSKFWRIFPIKVYLHILPVIKYTDYKDLDIKELTEMVYNEIDKKLNDFKQSEGN